MAAEILTQRTESFAELSAVYGEKGVAGAQARLQVVLEFKSLKPKTVRLNCRRVPSPAVDELARKAGVSLGTLWRWYRLYRSAYASAQGNVHLKAKAGFEALTRTSSSCCWTMLDLLSWASRLVDSSRRRTSIVSQRMACDSTTSTRPHFAHLRERA